jgi:hypothetical protein
VFDFPPLLHGPEVERTHGSVREVEFASLAFDRVPPSRLFSCEQTHDPRIARG